MNGDYPDSASLTVGIKIDGVIQVSGTVASFIDGVVRSVQDELTAVPNIASAGDWAGLEWATVMARPWRQPPSSQALGELQAYALACEYTCRRSSPGVR